MPPSIYLIEPQANFPHYFSAEVVDHIHHQPLALIANLSLTTVAAFIPAEFEITLCDEQITPVNLDHPAQFIGLTGKVVQRNRMIELAKQFRARGKVVIIGGPYASLVPEDMRPHCDILVRGEIEAIAPQLFADLQTGQWQAEYIGGQPDLSLSPPPRWDLYPHQQATIGSIQTARGCPFECEFCDVIVYAGRKPRHKSVKQVLAELDQLYAYGYSTVFIADDNFTAYRRRAKELLTAIRDWNIRQADGRMSFITQLSIDIARDTEVLQLCAEAGLGEVYIGIETPNDASLKEAKKRQNVGLDLVAQIKQFLKYGITVIAGMVVGFDHDGPDIFDTQYQFAMQSPVPIFTLGALVAPEATPLHHRLAEAGRLVTSNSESHNIAGHPWSTNIIPKHLTQADLLQGIRWLGNRLYAPEAIGQRINQFISAYQPPPYRFDELRPRSLPTDPYVHQLINKLLRNLQAETDMFEQILETVEDNKFLSGRVYAFLFQYTQIRYMYQLGLFWEPQLAQQSAPMLFSNTELTPFSWMNLQ